MNTKAQATSSLATSSLAPSSSGTFSAGTIRGLVGLAVVGWGLTLATGCTRVAPYERAKLAHPTMAANEMAGPGEEHLRAVTEGAIGGSAGAGSGCGCN
ncbi:MAG: DUF4266 domain-containing protein [Myxococcota bacterium]